MRGTYSQCAVFHRFPVRLLLATRHEHLATAIASMVVALPIHPKLCIGDEIVSTRLGKAVAVVSVSVIDADRKCARRGTCLRLGACTFRNGQAKMSRGTGPF